MAQALEKAAVGGNEVLGTLDAMPTYLQLHCLSWLSCLDIGRVMVTCKELCVLGRVVNDASEELSVMSTAEVAAAAGAGAGGDGVGVLDVCTAALDGMRARPQFGLVFHRGVRRDVWKKFAQERLPKGVVLIAGRAQDVQSCGPSGKVDANNELCLQLGSFPRAVCTSFEFSSESGEEEVLRILEAATPAQSKAGDGLWDDDFWKIFVVVATGGGDSVSELNTLLRKHSSKASIIGGLLSSVDVKRGSDREMKNVRSGAVVLAFGGNVPLRSCVSMGLERTLPNDLELVSHNIVRPGTPTHDRMVSFSTHDRIVSVDLQQLIQLDMIEQVRDPVTNTNGNLPSFLARGPQPEYVGFKRPGETGFTVHVTGGSFHINGEDSLFILGVGDDLGAGTKFNGFRVTDESRAKEIVRVMSMLHDTVERNEEKVIGALMFSCLLRGPDPISAASGPMLDASAFSAAFPGVPLSGVYANGEIGPMARGGVELDAFEAGKFDIAIQGFTAVFGIFIAPKVTDSERFDRGGASVADHARTQVMRFLRGGEAATLFAQ